MTRTAAKVARPFAVGDRVRVTRNYISIIGLPATVTRLCIGRMVRIKVDAREFFNEWIIEEEFLTPAHASEIPVEHQAKSSGRLR